MIVFKGGRVRVLTQKSPRDCEATGTFRLFGEFPAERRGIFHSTNISFDTTSQAPPVWKLFFFVEFQAFLLRHIFKWKRRLYARESCGLNTNVRFLLSTVSQGELRIDFWEDEEASPRTLLFFGLFLQRNFQETGKMFRNGCFAKWFRFNWFSTSPQRRSSQLFFSATDKKRKNFCLLRVKSATADPAVTRNATKLRG